MKDRASKVNNLRLFLIQAFETRFKIFGWRIIRRRAFPNQFIVANSLGDQFRVTIQSMKEKYADD